MSLQVSTSFFTQLKRGRGWQIFDTNCDEPLKFKVVRNKQLFLIGLLIIFLAGFFYLYLVWRVSDTLVEQIQFKEERLAKAGAKTIELFVSTLGFQTSVFATRISIVTPNPQDTPRTLKTLVEGMYATPMTGAILADSQGTVLYGYEKPGSFAGGEDISDREYFKWAKTAGEGEIFVGAPIISKLGYSKGRYIVPLATPVIKNGEFNGVFVTAFFVDELTTQYLEDELKIRGNTRIYLVDADGLVLSSATVNLVGRNYLDFIKSSKIENKDKIYETLKKALASENIGSIDISLPDETKNGEMTRFLIGYSPVKLNGIRWTLAVATPKTDALASLYPLHFRDLGIAGLVVLVSLMLAVYLEKTLDILGTESKVTKGKKEIPAPNTKKE